MCRADIVIKLRFYIIFDYEQGTLRLFHTKSNTQYFGFCPLVFCPTGHPDGETTRPHNEK